MSPPSTYTVNMSKIDILINTFIYPDLLMYGKSIYPVLKGFIPRSATYAELSSTSGLQNQVHMSKRKKWFLLLLSSFVALIVIFILLLPTLLSTNAGKNALIKLVERKDSKLSIEDLSLSWMGNQEIKNFSFSEEGLELSFKSLSSECSFWNLIFRSGSMGTTRIDSPKIIVETKISQKKEDHLKEVETKKSKKEEVWSDFRGHLIATNGNISINGEFITITDLFLDIAWGKETQFKIEGNTKQNALSGNFSVQGKKEESFEGSAVINNFPIEGFDRLMGTFYPKYQGILLATLGDTLNANLAVVPDKDALNISMSVLSPRLNASIKGESLKNALNLTIQSTLKYQGEEPASVQGTLSIRDFFGERSFPTCDLNFHRLPLTFIDTLNNTHLVTYLGKTANGKILKSNEKLTLSASTPLLQFPLISLTLGKTANLVAPSSFTYLITPTLYKEIGHPFNLQGTINTLSIPMKEDAFLFSKMAFDTSIKGEKIALKDFELPFINAQLKGSSLDTIQFNGETQVNFVSGSWQQWILGKAPQVKANGILSLKDKLEVSPLEIILDGKKIEGAIKNDTFFLAKRFQADFLLEPDPVNAFLSKEDLSVLLNKPFPLYLEIEPSEIPLKDGFQNALLKGKGSIKSLSLVNSTNNYLFELKNALVTFYLDGKKSSHLIHFEGDTSGKVEIDLAAKNISDLFSSPDSIKASLNKFSSEIADVFLQTKGHLPDMIGPTFDLKYGMEKEVIDFYFDSKTLTCDGSFIAKDTFEIRSSRQPLQISWNLSEKSYNAFRLWQNPSAPPSPFQIDGVGTLKVQVSSLSLPLKEKGTFFPKVSFNLFESTFNANMQLDDLKLKHGRTKELGELKRFDFDVAKKSLGNEPLAFKFDGNLSPYGKEKSGQIQGEGSMRDFLSQSGRLDFSNITTSIHASIKNLPSLFIDALANSEFPPSAFLGEIFNATLDTEIKKSQGKINMEVDASACHATFSGIVSNNFLYLHDPIKAVFTVTPELNHLLAKSANLVIVAIEKPITLLIHDKGFSVPLKNFSTQNMSFNYGQLDLGEILAQNTGSASEIGGLFKLDARGNQSFWFAPSEFQMKQGKLYVDRTEILYNRAYQLCLWGDINFPRKYVDMILGLTAGALRSTLGIQGISDDYILKVPVEGRFGNVKIDTGAATGKIGFLIARKQVAPQFGRWGKVLGAIGDLTDDQSDVPPPKPPFPWQQP